MLSKSTTTMWESICLASYLILGLSSLPSSSYFPPVAGHPLNQAWTGGSSGSGTWVGSLKGEVLGRFMASTAAIQPYMNPIYRASKMTRPLEFSTSLKPMSQNYCSICFIVPFRSVSSLSQAKTTLIASASLESESSSLPSSTPTFHFAESQALSAIMAFYFMWANSQTFFQRVDSATCLRAFSPSTSSVASFS